MIKPTVGRIVWFHPHADDGGDPNGQPHAAIIVHVHGERMINLTVFNENGSTYAKRSVQLLQEGDHNPGHNYAEWMPYQVGQAAKTEAALKAANPIQVVDAPPVAPAASPASAEGNAGGQPAPMAEGSSQDAAGPQTVTEPAAT